MKTLLKTIAIIATAFLISSCGPPNLVENKKELTSGGTFIGRMLNGKNLYMYNVSVGNGGWASIFYTSDDQPITVNYRQGKTTVTNVLIDGVEYTPVEK